MSNVDLDTETKYSKDGLRQVQQTYANDNSDWAYKEARWAVIEDNNTGTVIDNNIQIWREDGSLEIDISYKNNRINEISLCDQNGVAIARIVCADRVDKTHDKDFIMQEVTHGARVAAGLHCLFYPSKEQEKIAKEIKEQTELRELREYRKANEARIKEDKSK